MNEYLNSISDLSKNAILGIPYILPEIALIITFLAVILVDLFFSRKKSLSAFCITVGGIIISGFLTNSQYAFTGETPQLFFGNIKLDAVAVSFKLIFAFAVVLFALFIRNNQSLQTHKKGVGDLYMLLPAVLLGLNLMAMSTSLLMVYLSIEMVSIGSYLMVGYVSGEAKQTEASMKYALFGSACSAIMLYGISLLYAYTGSINFAEPGFLAQLSAIPKAASALAILLLLVGIGFKLSFVPLHFWSPDAYQGAPAPVTAFLSTAPKIAGFAILIRFLIPLQSYQTFFRQEIFDFETILSVIAVLTMIVGNFAAIWQNNVKRMLAYSSIGHTGFALMAVVSFSQNGLNALYFYFTIYTIMNMAAFMLAERIEEQSGAGEAGQYKGLGRFFKTEMVCFVIILISLTGLPPTGGFFGKLYIFSAVFERYSVTGSNWGLALLVTGAVTTVVSLFYYLKIPLNAYLRRSEKHLNIQVKTSALTYLIIVLTFCVILFGIFPSILF